MKAFSICSLALITSFIAANTTNVQPASAETIHVYFGAVVQASEVAQDRCVTPRTLQRTSPSNALLNTENDSSVCAVTQEIITTEQAATEQVAEADQHSSEVALGQSETAYIQVTTVIQ